MAKSVNEGILLELAKAWEADAKEPVDMPLGEEAKEYGRKEGLMECADGLRSIIKLLARE
jgi:hypothetical protein